MDVLNGQTTAEPQQGSGAALSKRVRGRDQVGKKQKKKKSGPSELLKETSLEAVGRAAVAQAAGAKEAVISIDDDDDDDFA